MQALSVPTYLILRLIVKIGVRRWLRALQRAVYALMLILYKALLNENYWSGTSHRIHLLPFTRCDRGIGPADSISIIFGITSSGSSRFEH